jgi:hypothetical protein
MEGGKRLAKGVERGLKEMLLGLRKTVVKKLSLAVGYMICRCVRA